MNILTRLPTSEYLYKSLIAIIRRFPFVTLCALFGTAIAINLVESVSVEIAGEMIKQKLLMVAALGLPLFIALTVFGESKDWSVQKVLLLKAAAVAVLAVYYFSLPEQIVETGTHFLRFWLLLLGLHLAVAFLPYLRGKETAGFWQFNKTLFMRALLATLFTGVLYIGLIIALAAADHLFGMEIKDERYFQLWIIIVGIFFTGIFLAGIPADLRNLNGLIGYPKGLKIFTQYILLPLVTLYFVILIAYEAKIIITWNWPKGWVSHLVLWYSVVGLFSMLMLHPLRERTGNLWIKRFFKWFFWTLIPLVVMLVLAVLRRVSDYGITENRYFVMGLALGLIIVVVYFVFSRRRDIRVIPIAMCCLTFLSTFGPWSAFSVSKSSQMSRLESLFIQNELLVEGLVQKSTVEIPFADRKDISSILRYLISTHGPESLSHWFADSALASLDTVPVYQQAVRITKYMGFDFVSNWQTPDHSSFLSLKRESGVPFALDNYEFLIEFHSPTMNEKAILLPNESDTCYIRLDSDLALFEVILNDGFNTLRLPLKETIFELNEAVERNSLSSNRMTFFMPGDSFEAKVVFDNITGSYWGRDSVKVTNLSGILFIQMR